MTRGVPRLKELLKVTENPKATSLTIYLRPDIRDSKDEARRLAQELEFTTIRDIVLSSRVYYDPHADTTIIPEDQEWLDFFNAMEETDPNSDSMDTSPWIIRMEMDREKMFNKNITMDDIKRLMITNNADVNVAYTDHNSSRLVFRIKMRATKESSKKLDWLATIKEFQNTLMTARVVKGLSGLRSVSFRRLEESDQQFERNLANDGKYEAVPEFVLDTFGTNFLDVLIHPDVDGRRLISNHVHDIYENLGIEAARQILFREIFTLFEQAAPVNYRHVSLLCDAMCNRGRMMSADRNGVNKKKIGPLAKASFEQAGDIMMRAALFGEVDTVTGVSANIMTGQPIRGGTSFAQVLLDEGSLRDMITTAPAPRRELERAPRLVQDEVERMIEQREVVSVGCRTEDLRIPAALPPMEEGVEDGELPELEVNIMSDDEE
jgi:DNA-directed RNA polymerase II subunit RPB1